MFVNRFSIETSIIFNMSYPHVSRRHMLQATLGCASLTSLVSATANATPSASDSRGNMDSRRSFAIDGTTEVRLMCPSLSDTLQVMVIADTHLFKDDVRGEPFTQYSGRMAKSYNRTKHYRTGIETSPEVSFVNTLQIAKKNNVDVIALVGDIFSFPSEAAIEWVQSKLQEIGLPFFYIAGNHDWHYEGMEGPLSKLRATWIADRLKPLYQSHNPMMFAQEFKGVRLLAIDNSTYEILPEQLDFFREEASTGKPLVLFVHIPLYAPGRPVGFGCGHPLWSAATDRNFQIERRPQWPVEGHNQVTMEFYREVTNTPNLLGVFSGHTHQFTVDTVNGLPLIVSGGNFNESHIHLSVMAPQSA